MRDTIMRARLAEWSKAWDLSSHNRKIAWVRTPHLAWVPFANRLQWRNRLAHGTYRQYKELCRGCEFEPHLEQQPFLLREKSFLLRKKIFLPDRESNPGLPRDRRRSSPLDYRGIGGCWPRTAPEELIIVTHQCHPKKSLTQLVGFEPTLPEGNWFRVSRLNHSATTAALLHCNKVDQHRWFSGRMLACHAGGPGSIPGRCKHFFASHLQPEEKKTMECAKEQKGAGDGGYRSPYLSHAKRALYHLSYVPICTPWPVRTVPHSDLSSFDEILEKNFR